MMPWVHASIGALAGSLSQSRKSAFMAGAASHAVADLVPHRDFSLPAEIPLLVVALALIAKRFGVASQEMAGAVGAVLPDAENALERLGFVKHMVFPTHTKLPWSIGHGKSIKNPWPQVALALCCIVAAHYASKRKWKA